MAQSQTCVQELTTELRNRCLELRELSHRIQDEEKLLQVRAGLVEYIFLRKKKAFGDDVVFKYSHFPVRVGQ